MRTWRKRTTREKSAAPIWFAALIPTRIDPIGRLNVQGIRWRHDARRAVTNLSSEPEAAQPFELLLALPRR
jgi:hypothetical protein